MYIQQNIAGVLSRTITICQEGPRRKKINLGPFISLVLSEVGHFLVWCPCSTISDRNQGLPAAAAAVLLRFLCSRLYYGSIIVMAVPMRIIDGEKCVLCTIHPP